MIGCIIQARMGSSRLPGKVLMKSENGRHAKRTHICINFLVMFLHQRTNYRFKIGKGEAK